MPLSFYFYCFRRVRRLPWALFLLPPLTVGFNYSFEAALIPRLGFMGNFVGGAFAAAPHFLRCSYKLLIIWAAANPR